MPNPSPLLPDPMPLRDALRGLRHVMRTGGATLFDTVRPGDLPRPVSGLAGAVLREVEGLARGVDGMASDLARGVLAGERQRAPSLRDMGALRDASMIFASAAYSALQAVLRRLGAAEVYVSESALRRAFDAAGQRAADPTEAFAADLSRAVISAQALRGATGIEGLRVPRAALEPVAVFAVMLWLQSDRSEADDEAALHSATDLAMALSGDVAAAFADPEAARLAALYREFASHV